MRVYFTGAPVAGEAYLRLMARRQVMFSYLVRRRAVWRDLSVFGGVAVDSGAYSVWSRGAKVDLGEYGDYCAAVGDEVDWYANLDVIDDWRAGQRNLAALERRGLSPVPVFHLGEPWGLLEDMVSAYDRVGLGRGPGVSFSETWRLLEAIFARYSDSGGAPLVKFHGFRMTDIRLMRRFPFDSVDSTTWIAGSAYGELPRDGGRARGFSFLSEETKARVWLEFFDAAKKACRFEAMRKEAHSTRKRRGVKRRA